MGLTLLLVMEPGCFTPVKKLGTKDKAAIGKEVAGNHSCFASNTVRFGALFMWGHTALTSLTGNQKTPYSIISGLHNVCYSLGRNFITQNYCLFRHLCVFSGMS